MSLGPAKAALTKAITVAEANPWIQQLGQANDTEVWNGQTACTHTVCQFLALLWFGQHLTLNQVNKLAGMPRNAATRNPNGSLRPRGMNNLEFQRFFDATGLPYVVRFGLDFETVLTYSNKAPVPYAVRYGSEPTQKGFVYHGVHAKPPYATLNGATQLTGSLINGRHMGLLLGYRSIISSSGKITGYREWRKDPNHGSSARPEQPPYDLITTGQGKVEYDAYHDTKGHPRVYCALPTRSLPV